MKEKNMVTILVPPDGGWGWMICCAYALNNILIIPIMQSFGLIFKEKFARIGLSATDIALIINTNSSFGMMMGLVNGSLLKSYGYRKMAIIGAILISGGVIITAFANSFEYFLISYGIITSLGFGLSMAAFSLALNSYFKKRRGIATGFAMTGTGLGPIIMPLLISFLLSEYGTLGCTLIIGGLSLNSLAAGILLQPLKWHMKKEIPDVELQNMENIQSSEINENLLNKEDENYENEHQPIFSSTLSIDHDTETQSIYGFETPLPRRKISTSSIYETGRHRKRTFSRSISQSHPDKQSNLSINSLHSLKSISELEKLEEKNEKANTDLNKRISESETKDISENKSYFSRVASFFDLDLLLDPIYLNLMFGMSLAVCAEINFSLLTPFILSDFQFDNFQIAKIMSVLATSDILFRFCAPFIADWLKFTPKMMYTLSLLMLVVSRTTLLFTNSYLEVIFVAIALGIAKGFRTVFMSLLIPSYVPIEKLASASGIQMVTNGIINMVGGPFLGLIRDVTGSYNTCIIVINSITVLTVIMWTIEFIILKIREKSKI